MAKYADYKAEKERDEIAKRRKVGEANRDPELEQCVIAYVNRVKEFGPQSWELFRQEWFRGKQS